MKICTANLYFNAASARSSPTSFLERMPLFTRLPAIMAAAGHQVDVVQLFPTKAVFAVDDVTYHFVRPALLEKGWAWAAGRTNGRQWTRHVPAFGAVRRVLSLEPDVIHFHGLTLNASLFLLQALRGEGGPAIVGQHHGHRPNSGPLSGRMSRRGLADVQRAIFSRREAAERFVEAGLLEDRQVVEMMDQSATFTMRSRPEARQASGLDGSPIFLWTANLEPEWDPMTAVQGFERILRTWSKAELFLYYEKETMLAQLKAYVVARPALAGHVHFQGRLENGSLEVLLNSTDFLMRTDRESHDAHVIVEAMACGAIPIVSDIPLFRRLVDNGRCGFLFPKGDARALAEEVLAFSPSEIAGRAAVVHDWFEAAYSYEAMAGLLLDVYWEAINERLASGDVVNVPVAESSQG